MFKSALLLALGYGTLLPLVSAGPDYLDPRSFLRRRYHASAKVGRYIYIDGGELAWKDSNATVINAQNPMTQVIDLTNSWTNSSVQIREIDRGGAPILNYRTFWVDDNKSTIYTFGGEASWLTSDVPAPPQPWIFKANGSGGGGWTKGRIDRDTNFPAILPAGVSYTHGNGIGYSLGGHLSDKDLPASKWLPVNGLLTYNMSSNKYTNVSAEGYGYDQVAQQGVAHFVPSLGPSGMLVFLGGRDASWTRFSDLDPKRTFADITLYDPSSGKWFHQNATGVVPSWRYRTCAVGAQGQNNTYEIFIYSGCSTSVYGGVYPSPVEAAATTSLDEIYVLSLPAFVWFKADYPAKSSRQSHTCHVVGNRQLLTVGGIDGAFQENDSFNLPNATDPFALGLGIFDLTKMEWSNKYDADALPYESPQVISEYYRSNPRYPEQWASSDLQDLIVSGTPASNTTTSAPPGNDADNLGQDPESEKSKGSNVAMIAGVATGALALLVVSGLLIRYLRRRRKTRMEIEKVQKESEKPGPELDSSPCEELAGAQRYELPEKSLFEMPAAPRIPQIRIETA